MMKRSMWQRAAFVAAGAATGGLVGTVCGLLVLPELAIVVGVGGVLWGVLAGFAIDQGLLRLVLVTAVTAWFAAPVVGGVLFAALILIARIGS
jgi:hypothetical protein